MMDLSNYTGDLLELEKANVKLVNAFIGSWYEPAKVLFSLIAPDGVCRTSDTLPSVVGPAGAKEEWERYLTAADRVEVDIHETFCRGPVVTNVRTDVVKTPGKPDRVFEIVGVFLLKDGKIKEWTDHIYRWSEAA
jgi:limonene-1,2-epoxide hydrolase